VSEARELLNDPRVRASREGVVVAATSMGALVGLNWVRRHRQSVVAVLLACPVLDLEDVYWNNKGGFRQKIAAAHDIKPTADPESASRVLGERSPVQFAKELEGIPMRLYASSDDQVASDTERCIDWVKEVGGGAGSVLDLGAAGHWPVATPADDAVAFASRFV
jgi:pimeloyl-ACP methyl ester carboxylesterase